MRRLIRCAVAAGVTAALVLPIPAGAATELSGASLVLTLYDGTDTFSPVLAEVTVKCDPTGGTHADAEGACETLEDVDGDLSALESLGLFCPMIFQPVTVEVGGNWREQVVRYEGEYPNRCVAFDESQGLFQF